ncbi:hypothetical protein [Xanthomonas virus PB119]|nr:hypothetical protein [Xanthomonas virus PB119]
MEVANTDRKVNAALMGNAGESHAVQVAGTREFIEMLSSNLYSRPKEAMIREVLCNADDAHKEAGYLGPIEIQITDDNTLIIRDRGLGIPHDKMHLIYGTYGGSTKKKDSMATGGFGLGCKSPWSYTDAFTVANCHGGTKTLSTMLRVSADHGGLPAIVPIAQFDTQETGLEVRIDLKASDRIEITNLIKSIVHRGGINATLNGEELVCVDYSGNDTYKFIPNSHFNHKIMVKYGAVLYPVEDRDVYSEYYHGITNYMNHNHTLVLLAPADSLVISPNRENVSYLEKTEKQIWMLLREFMIEINRKAAPYARKLIKESNERYIKRAGINWMQTLRNTGYLDSPTFDANFYKLDIFSQVIHSKLTHQYPSELHKEALKHRFQLTKPLVEGPWKKKLLVELERQAIDDHQAFVRSGKGANKFFRHVSNELIKIAVREGWDLSKIRFGERTQFYIHGRHTTVPQVITDHPKKFGEGLDEQRYYLDAPVILSHTVKGITEDAKLPYAYYAMVIPRSGPGSMVPADVAARLERYGLTVIDVTPQQKLESTARVASSTKFPTLGALRTKKMLDQYNDNQPKLCQTHKIPKEDWCETPVAYMKIAGRSSAYILDPVDGDRSSYKPFQHLIPDDTAIVTTEADVKKLIKLGAVHWMQTVYNHMVMIWSDPKVRQAYAWVQGQGNGISVVKKYMASPWYCKQFDLPQLTYDKDMCEKLALLSAYFDERWKFHTQHKTVDDVAKLIPAMSAIRKGGEPKKLRNLKSALRNNSIIGNGVDIDDLLSMQDSTQDPKVKDKLNRIIKIIME